MVTLTCGSEIMSQRCLVTEFLKTFFQNSANLERAETGRFCVFTFLTSTLESVPKNQIFCGKMSSASSLLLYRDCDSELVRSVFTHVPDQLGLRSGRLHRKWLFQALTPVLMGL